MKIETAICSVAKMAKGASASWPGGNQRRRASWRPGMAAIWQISAASEMAAGGSGVAAKISENRRKAYQWRNQACGNVAINVGGGVARK